MATLDELEAAAIAARKTADEAHRRLDSARSDAQQAIMRHATVQARVVGGAGAQKDVDDAAVVRDDAITALRAVRSELRA